MKSIFTLPFLLFLFTPHLTSAPSHPNILVIMADDLGFSDIGAYGSEIETPTLDQLAEEGLRFSHFYNTAKCHSSRICLLTGLYNLQAGEWTMHKGITIAEALKPSGYRTFRQENGI